jgi:antitoxin ParD1/3/4
MFFVVATMNISLPDEMKAHVEAQVRSGQFANASDYIRNLIRYDQRELDLLRAAIDAGDASPDSKRSLDEIIASALEAIDRG